MSGDNMVPRSRLAANEAEAEEVKAEMGWRGALAVDAVENLTAERDAIQHKFDWHVETWLKAEEGWIETEKRLSDAITAALAELKRNKGTPHMALRGVERILKNAVGGG